MKKVSPFNTINKGSSNRNTSSILVNAAQSNYNRYVKQSLIKAGLIDLLENEFIREFGSDGEEIREYLHFLKNNDTIYTGLLGSEDLMLGHMFPYSVIFKNAELDNGDISKGFTIQRSAGKFTIIFNIYYAVYDKTSIIYVNYLDLDYINSIQKRITHAIKSDKAINSILSSNNVSEVEVKFFIQNYADKQFEQSLTMIPINALPDMMVDPNTTDVYLKAAEIDFESTDKPIKFYEDVIMNYKFSTNILKINYNANHDNTEFSEILKKVSDNLRILSPINGNDFSIMIKFNDALGSEYALLKSNDISADKSNIVAANIKKVYEGFGKILLEHGINTDYYTMQYSCNIKFFTTPVKDILHIGSVHNKICEIGRLLVAGSLKNNTCKATGMCTKD